MLTTVAKGSVGLIIHMATTSDIQTVKFMYLKLKKTLHTYFVGSFMRFKDGEKRLDLCRVYGVRV